DAQLASRTGLYGRCLCAIRRGYLGVHRACPSHETRFLQSWIFRDCPRDGPILVGRNIYALFSHREKGRLALPTSTTYFSTLGPLRLEPTTCTQPLLCVCRHCCVLRRCLSWPAPRGPRCSVCTSIATRNRVRGSRGTARTTKGTCPRVGVL